MPEAALQTYRVAVSGLWNTRHTFTSVTTSGGTPEGTSVTTSGGTPEGTSVTEAGETPEGVLTVRRSRFGRVTSAEYRPAKGEVLIVRRDPGLLRSQFSLWTDGTEWLGSSLRWGMRRQIDLSTGSKPLYLLPVAGLRAGWGIYAPKSGEMARIVSSFTGRSARIEVFRRIDFPILVFSYFVGNQVHLESIAPGPEPDKVKARASATAV